MAPIVAATCTPGPSSQHCPIPRPPNTSRSFFQSSGRAPVAVHVLAYDVDAGIHCPPLPTAVDDDDYYYYYYYGAKTHSKVASEACSTPAKPHRTTKPCILRLPWPKCYFRAPRPWIHSETIVSLSLSLSISYCQNHAPTCGMAIKVRNSFLRRSLCLLTAVSIATKHSKQHVSACC